MGQPAVLPSRRLHRGGWLLRLVIIHSERVSGPTLHECASCWLLRTLRSYVKFAVSSGRNGAGRELSLHVERVWASIAEEHERFRVLHVGCEYRTVAELTEQFRVNEHFRV